MLSVFLKILALIFQVKTVELYLLAFDKFYSIIKKSGSTNYELVKYLITNTEMLIVDEAHHSLAETYNVCINSFKNTPYIKILGLSATPGTNDTGKQPLSWLNCILMSQNFFNEETMTGNLLVMRFNFYNKESI